MYPSKWHVFSILTCKKLSTFLTLPGRRKFLGKDDILNNKNMRFELLIAVKIQVNVFWVVTPCSVAVGYHFRRPTCLNLQGEVK
jgi:hypothetical protein